MEMLTLVSREEAPYSNVIVVFPSLGGGGVEPGWAVQVLSIKRVSGESSIPVNEKSLSPPIAIVSPDPTSPSN